MKRFFCLMASLLGVLNIPMGLASQPQATVNSETRYALDYVQGGNLVSVEYRNVYYADSTNETYINPYEAPTFISSRANACAVEAGGNAIAYYDRLYDDLIPGYKHNYVWGKFTYGTQNDAVDNMFWSLYDLMGTNNSGTTVSGFKNGINSYVTGKGHASNIVDATGNYCNTDLNFLKSQLEQEKMAVIFIDTFSITPLAGIQNNDGYDVITHYVYSGCHAMLVYGYKDIFYYNDSGTLISRDTYLYAATGYAGTSLGLLNINNYCMVDDVYIVSIT